MNRFKILALAAVVTVTSSLSRQVHAHEPSALTIPTEMEIFAKRVDTQTAWGRAVAMLESDGTRVSINAIALKSSKEPAMEMRGVKIDLADATTTDTVYLQERDIQTIRTAAERIGREMKEFGTDNQGTPHCHGAKEFWNTSPRYHSLSVDYCVHSTWSGLSLTTFRDHRFNLPKTYPSALAEALGRALDEFESN